ncbi:hypothetical protein [Aeromonas phage AerS_266]|nr:hypothetical protein [Aeromonas phage AerS_266]
MKLRMSVLKLRIGSQSCNLVKFAKGEIDNIQFSISVDMDYKLVLTRTGKPTYFIEILDSVTNQVKPISYGNYPHCKGKTDTKIFLEIEKDLLNILGTLMFSVWSEKQYTRTKGKKKIAKLIVEQNPEFSEEGIIQLLNSKPTEARNWPVEILIKSVRTKYCQGEILDYEDIIISMDETES